MHSTDFNKISFVDMTDIGKFTELENKYSILVTMETMTFWIWSSEKWLFGFNLWNHVPKTESFLNG